LTTNKGSLLLLLWLRLLSLTLPWDLLLRLRLRLWLWLWLWLRLRLLSLTVPWDLPLLLQDLSLLLLLRYLLGLSLRLLLDCCLVLPWPLGNLQLINPVKSLVNGDNE
jgi:hypothetical protein